MIGDITFQVTAREGSIKVAAICPYAGRTVSISEEVTDEKLLSDLGKVFEKAKSQVEDSLRSKAYMAAAEAMIVAGKRGEI